MSSTAGWVHRLYAEKPQNHQLIILVSRAMYSVRSLNEHFISVSPVIRLEVQEDIYDWDFSDLTGKMEINNYWYFPEGSKIQFGAFHET